MRYGAEVSYISLKTTRGNVRLNVLGERRKEGHFFQRGAYESRNYGAYYRLKKAFGEYRVETAPDPSLSQRI